MPAACARNPCLHCSSIEFAASVQRLVRACMHNEPSKRPSAALLHQRLDGLLESLGPMQLSAARSSRVLESPRGSGQPGRASQEVCSLDPAARLHRQLQCSLLQLTAAPSSCVLESLLWHSQPSCGQAGHPVSLFIEHWQACALQQQRACGILNRTQTARQARCVLAGVQGIMRSRKGPWAAADQAGKGAQADAGPAERPSETPAAKGPRSRASRLCGCFDNPCIEL